MAAKTESHRQLAEKMRTGRGQASALRMSRAEFLAQTPQELRVATVRGTKSPGKSGRR